MIIREILDHPELIESFDFFNNSKDTINWLMSGGHENLARKLRQADRVYWKNKSKKYKYEKEYPKYKNSEKRPCKGDRIKNFGVEYEVKGVSKDGLRLFLVGFPMTDYANTRCSSLI